MRWGVGRRVKGYGVKAWLWRTRERKNQGFKAILMDADEGLSIPITPKPAVSSVAVSHSIDRHTSRALPKNHRDRTSTFHFSA